jgi:ribosomal protein S27E
MKNESRVLSSRLRVRCPECRSSKVGQVVYESGEVDDEQVFCIACDFVFAPDERGAA